MADFSNCSGIAISGGNFTKANHISNIRMVRRSVVRVQGKEERRTKWDDYNRVRIGDICIESSITATSIRKDYDNEGTRKQYQLGQDTDARRNFGIARLRGEDSKNKYLCVMYSGSDAFKAFKQDFDEFSQIKHANLAQIFGFNDNERGIPALLFYDALIPLERIIRGNDGWNLPLLYSYFDYQLGRMRREIPVGALQRIAELWVDPTTGALQRGPYIEKTPSQDGLLLGTIESAMPNVHHTATYLSIPTLSDNDVVLDYLARTFTTHTVLQGIHWFARPFVKHLPNEHLITVLSSLPGTIYNRHSRDIVARWLGARERLQYMVGTVYRIPNAMRDSQFVVGGSVRFTATSTEINKLQEIHLRYSLPWEKRDILERSWLAQAHHVFSQLQIHADEWKDYAMPFGFDVCLVRTLLRKELNISSKVYLFIPPVPRPSDDETIWRSWVEGERYFWSFDPFGREKVSDVELASSGIPSFTCMIFSFGYTWTSSHYDIMQKIHTAKGFNPVTTDLTLSTGYPILQVIGNDDRFENFEESSFDMLPPRAGGIRGSGRTSAVRLNQTSGTKSLRTPNAKTVRSSSSMSAAQGTSTKPPTRVPTVRPNHEFGTTADAKIMRSSSRVQASSKQPRADPRKPHNLGTEQKGQEGVPSRIREAGASECKLDVSEHSLHTTTRHVSFPPTRRITSLVAARKVDDSSGGDRQRDGKPAWR